MTSGANTRHSYQHSPQWYHNQEHQHGFGMHHSPLTSLWPSVVSQAKDINPNPNCSKTMDLDTALRGSMDLDVMASGGNIGHLHQHAPPPLEAQCTEIRMASGGSPDQEHLHSLCMESEARDNNMAPGVIGPWDIHRNLWLVQISKWPLGAAQTKEIFQGGPVQNMNHSSSWTSYCCSEPG